MYTQTLLLVLSLAGVALSDPKPQIDTSSFDMSQFTSVDNIYSDMPTLPPSIASIIATAAPTGTTDSDPCATTLPAWYGNLPDSVQSELSSYNSAVQSWASEHSSELGDGYTAYASPTGDFCGTRTGGAGPENTGAAEGTQTSDGSAAKGTNTGAAARPTGAVAAAAAGVVGMVGLMVAL
jgi:hypothetical protein